MSEEYNGQLKHAGEIRRHILGGNAKFTIRHKESGERITYKVKSAAADRSMNWSTGNQNRDLYFVSVLTGPSNDSDFQYMGLLTKLPFGDFGFTTTRNSRVGHDSLAYKIFMKAWSQIEHGCRWPESWEFWHEGQCCACGRPLTVPESIAMGMGPDCAGKLGL